MSRVARSLALGLALCLSAPAVFAADYSPHGAPAIQMRKAATAAPDCREPEVVTAYFEEQVCHMGAGGYSDCRWVSREHDVRAPATCEPTVTSEDATPAARGAFPPYQRIAPRRG